MAIKTGQRKYIPSWACKKWWRIVIYEANFTIYSGGYCKHKMPKDLGRLWYDHFRPTFESNTRNFANNQVLRKFTFQAKETSSASKYYKLQQVTRWASNVRVSTDVYPIYQNVVRTCNTYFIFHATKSTKTSSKTTKCSLHINLFLYGLILLVFSPGTYILL